ncbi:hypothetical protein BGW38_002646 [Lunasporangiospora selenospora]|uniref:Uncharacterized protein n=1 Tax=Lunasporangiospora selenospora TaxID=979761 RepID=A0A9P6FSB0_9FUNG|nr:hypothetical protein BGW38_002646 [Lunasporangiospora selenospora]
MTMNVIGASICDEEIIVQGEARDIQLPNTEHVSQISVDVGGSLAKVIYFTRRAGHKGGRLNFRKFETEKIEECIDFIDGLLKESRVRRPDQDFVIKATGGGAHLYYDRFRERLGVSIQKEDEMECLITGLNFLITEIPFEVFTYSEANPMCFEETPANPFPYMHTKGDQQDNIRKNQWNLRAKTFDEMLEASQEGDNRNVDMLVGDIYGTDYSKIGLKSTTIASSMGKVFKKNVDKKSFRPQDISRSLLYMVSNNIGQIAYLNAQAHNLDRIYFGGCFIRGHPITMNTLSYAINFWSKGTKKALFLRHEGFLGAIGAFNLYPRRNSRSFTLPEQMSQKLAAMELPDVEATLAQETLDVVAAEESE